MILNKIPQHRSVPFSAVQNIPGKSPVSQDYSRARNASPNSVFKQQCSAASERAQQSRGATPGARRGTGKPRAHGEEKERLIQISWRERPRKSSSLGFVTFIAHSGMGQHILPGIGRNSLVSGFAFHCEQPFQSELGTWYIMHVSLDGPAALACRRMNKAASRLVTAARFVTTTCYLSDKSSYTRVDDVSLFKITGFGNNL